MGGKLIDAWDFMWPEVWEPLGQHDDADASYLADLFPLLNKAIRPFRTPGTGEPREQWESAKQNWDQQNALAATDSKVADTVMRSWTPGDFKGDAHLARALESVFGFLFDPETPSISEAYFHLTAQFLAARNIRYRLVPEFELRPLVSGMFSNLVARVEQFAKQEVDVQPLLEDFEYALNRVSRTREIADIRTLIGKASILAEAISGKHPEANGGTFGQHCSSVQCWPHATVRDVFKKLYGFCSDYPGIRHAGNAGGVIRPLKLQDGVVAALMFLSSTGYFMQELDFLDIAGAPEPPSASGKRKFVLGYDPGGNNKHGVALVEVELVDDKYRSKSLVILNDFDNVDSIIQQCEGSIAEGQVVASGIDTLTGWSVGESGWRSADHRLRGTYEGVKLSVDSANHINGSMCINGALVLRWLSRRWDVGGIITEVHPRVLYFALKEGQERHPWAKRRRYGQLVNPKPGNKKDAKQWLLDALGLRNEPISRFGNQDHRFDAMLACLAALRGLNGEWTTDLHQGPQAGFVRPFAPTNFWWPNALSDERQ